MDSRAPAVVAVVVTREPGPWFAEVLDTLATQDYQEFSVLILATGGADPTPVVSRHLPGAFVGHVEGDPGFGATANHALDMVEGAAFFLLLHDDVALAPDTVHLLVEEAFRSNAGVVGPKVVGWDTPGVLLHVGMNVDKTGAVVERVQLGEIDHGQHDGVRDVFEVPSGAMLVRADLFKEIGGFDPGIVGMGEDLDLCWRAQVAGSRVIVAPDAVVRHLQAVTGGLRSVASSADEQPVAPTLQELQRRHELRAVLKCYGLFNLLRVLPQAALLALGEFTVALAVRDPSPGARASCACVGLEPPAPAAICAHCAAPCARTVSCPTPRSVGCSCAGALDSRHTCRAWHIRGSTWHTAACRRGARTTRKRRRCSPAASGSRSPRTPISTIWATSAGVPDATAWGADRAACSSAPAGAGSWCGRSQWSC